MVDPELGLMCLRHFGCPNEILFALRQVWDQNRWLCFRRDCLPNPVHVTTSIPQGDTISPLTLLALLTGLTGRVLQERTEPHTLATFLDDRNLVAKTPEDAAKLWKTWKELSPRVGLQENDANVQVVPRAADFKPRLLQAGFSENQIADSARVLGVDITARLNATHRPTKETRIQETHARLERIGLLPVSADVKAFGHSQGCVGPVAHAVFGQTFVHAHQKNFRGPACHMFHQLVFLACRARFESQFCCRFWRLHLFG